MHAISTGFAPVCGLFKKSVRGLKLVVHDRLKGLNSWGIRFVIFLILPLLLVKWKNNKFQSTTSHMFVKLPSPWLTTFWTSRRSTERRRSCSCNLWLPNSDACVMDIFKFEKTGSGENYCSFLNVVHGVHTWRASELAYGLLKYLLTVPPWCVVAFRAIQV